LAALPGFLDEESGLSIKSRAALSLKYNLDTKSLPTTTQCYILRVTVTDTSTGEENARKFCSKRNNANPSPGLPTLTLAQVEFEQRLTAALLLEQNLLARETGVGPLAHEFGH
jgi:hypothetical protein